MDMIYLNKNLPLPKQLAGNLGAGNIVGLLRLKHCFY